MEVREKDHTSCQIFNGDRFKSILSENKENFSRKLLLVNLVSVCFLLLGFFFRIKSYLPIIIRDNLIIIFT